MIHHASLLKIRDHAIAVLLAVAAWHVVGLIDVVGFLPHATVALDRLSGQAIGMALCGLVYAIVITALARRRVVAGPLYRCGETRPASDHGKSFAHGSGRLLDSWQYR